MKKIIIIGLDGSTFDVLDPYIKQGMLPNIEHIIRNGVRGDMEAAIPPVTGPSWVSFMTGVGPGKHGIYDFVKPKPNSVKRQAVTYDNIHSPTLWDYLNKAGKSCGVVNLPITYPPPKVNGFVIPGLLTPNVEGEFAYPDGLMKEIRSSVGEYVLDVWWQKYGENGIEKFLDELQYCTEQRIKTMFYLLEKKKWDLFMGVFIGTDRIQHYIWQYIHPEKMEKCTPRELKIISRVADYYKQLDRFFGNLIERLNGDTDLFIVSDHGFGPLRGKMFINRWLEENGFLKVNRTDAYMASLKGRVFQQLRSVVRTLDPYGLRKKIGIEVKKGERLRAYDFLDCIDWDNSSAYSASNTEQGIYINLKDREPNGSVNGIEEYNRVRDEIIARLKNLNDPYTGEKIVSRIYKKEDLYQGPLMQNAPDIVLFLKDGEYLVDVQLKETLFEKAGWHSGWGTHRLAGIFMGYGPNIRKGTEINGTRIVDIAPTILSMLGIPIPEEMDGRPLLNIFKDGFFTENPVSYTSKDDGDDGTFQRGSENKTLSEQELEEVEEKLKGLGYL